MVLIVYHCFREQRATFSQDRDIDQSVQALIMRLLPLAPNYSNVMSWCFEIDRTAPPLAAVQQALH